jgi:heme/copper-type cytochrome/quinol oxidase subunit 4
MKVKLRGGIYLTILYTICSLLVFGYVYQTDMANPKHAVAFILSLGCIMTVMSIFLHMIYPKSKRWQRYRPLVITTILHSVLVTVAVYIFQRVFMSQSRLVLKEYLLLQAVIWIHGISHMLYLRQYDNRIENKREFLQTFILYQWYIMILPTTLVMMISLYEARQS